MNKESKQDIAKRARKVINAEMHGVLSTNSRYMSGFPFGSLVQYSFDVDGQPIILISHLAQHTRNILKDNKVSITVIENKEDVQSAGRVTILGKANLIDSESISARYYRIFPEAQEYHKTHRFDFYKIEVEKVRFIGGFGDIHWVLREKFMIENPFLEEIEISILEHMNKDHQSAMRCYFQKHVSQQCEPLILKMIAIDAEGMWIRNDTKMHYIQFDTPVSNVAMLRAILIAMAKLAA